MQEIIAGWLVGFPKEWATFFMAMLPVTELRAAIPVAILKYNLSPLTAFFYAVSGNVFLGIVTMMIIEPATKLVINKVEFLRKIWERYIGRIQSKHKDKFEKWQAWALITFVAIPLPMTGVFSGAVAASIFQIPFRKAVPLITLGCLISGTIVIMVTLIVS